MYIIKEAFKQGSALKVINKLAKVLTNQIHREFNFSPIGIEYINSFGKFIGFYGSVVGNQKLVRLNFSLTNSDTISSIDIYDKPSIKPTTTIDLEEFNIIQIIKIIVEELTGNIELEESLKEESLKAGSYEDRKKMVELWLKDVPDSIQLIMNQPLAKVYSGTYLKWAGDSDRALFPLYVFVQVCKEILFAKGLTNTSFRIRKKGTSERVVTDQALSDKFDDQIANTEWQEKFELLEFYVEQVVDNKVQSLIAWGSPGSGKSKTVYDTLNKLGVAYKLFKGGVKNTDELFNILTKYRDGEVLVFDDFDSAMKGDSVNVLKSALENTKSREVTWRDKILTFTSGIIFISNASKFDAALLSRSVSVEISLSNEQMIDKMDKTIDNFAPEVPLDIKKEVLDFLKEISGGVKYIDYRQFQICLVLRMGKQDKWKKWALMQLKAADNS